jgi:archaellum component FlaC
MLVRFLSPFLVFGALAVLCLAQTQNPPPAQGSSPATTPSSSTSTTTTPKKVWTNENLSETKGTVSVFGDKRNQNYHMGSGQPAGAIAAQIKKDLEKLQAQLDDVNKKLKTYKEFEEGEPVSKGERDLSKCYSRVPVDQQMVRLVDKRKKLQGQIGDLIDEARKEGIEPGQLR